ncbi:MAG: flavodoxin [Oscillospiraceae bacterium]
MRSLILYYTYHGNTQRIAERIHAAIGGDIAHIDTVEPYTGDYDDVVAQGEREVKQGYLPPLKPMDIDLDRYDTIVLGTPVWWYTCSPAMRAFLTAHDLSGKTVYPFATKRRLARPLDPGYAGAVPGCGVPAGAGRAL